MVDKAKKEYEELSPIVKELWDAEGAITNRAARHIEKIESQLSKVHAVISSFYDELNEKDSASEAEAFSKIEEILGRNRETEKSGNNK